jgi:hypothetical protein
METTTPSPTLLLEAFLTDSLRGAVESALRAGVPAETVLRLNAQALEPAVEAAIAAPARAGYASPAEGYLALINAEGGCISVNQVREVLGAGRGFTRQGVQDRIKREAMLAAKTPAGEYVIPRWQFAGDGTVLPGIVEAMKVLKESTPGYTPLAAFSFFLQPSPMLGFETPLAALKKRKVDEVLVAAREFAHS